MSIHYAVKMLNTYILDLHKIFYSSSVESDLKGEKSKLYILKYCIIYLKLSNFLDTSPFRLSKTMQGQGSPVA